MDSLVFVENNRVVTDSLTIADSFNKRHDIVLRDIEHQIEKLSEAGESEFSLHNFEESNYKNERGRTYKKYLLTEEGFAIITMSYVTVEAMKFKVKFITQFQTMKHQLSMLKADSYMIDDPIKRAERWIEEQKEKKHIEQQLQLAQPKVDVYEKFISSDKLHSMKEVAKIVGVGRQKLFEFLSSIKVLMDDRLPYQQYMNKYLFEVKDIPVKKYGEFINEPTTRVTSKGIEFIDKKLNEYGGSALINSLKLNDIEPYVVQKKAE